MIQSSSNLQHGTANILKPALPVRDGISLRDVGIFRVGVPAVSPTGCIRLAGLPSFHPGPGSYTPSQCCFCFAAGTHTPEGKKRRRRQNNISVAPRVRNQMKSLLPSPSTSKPGPGCRKPQHLGRIVRSMYVWTRVFKRFRSTQNGPAPTAGGCRSMLQGKPGEKIQASSAPLR